MVFLNCAILASPTSDQRDPWLDLLNNKDSLDNNVQEQPRPDDEAVLSRQYPEEYAEKYQEENYQQPQQPQQQQPYQQQPVEPPPPQRPAPRRPPGAGPGRPPFPRRPPGPPRRRPGNRRPASGGILQDLQCAVEGAGSAILGVDIENPKFQKAQLDCLLQKGECDSVGNLVKRE